MVAGRLYNSHLNLFKCARGFRTHRYARGNIRTHMRGRKRIRCVFRSIPDVLVIMWKKWIGRERGGVHVVEGCTFSKKRDKTKKKMTKKTQENKKM